MKKQYVETVIHESMAICSSCCYEFDVSEETYLRIDSSGHEKKDFCNAYCCSQYVDSYDDLPCGLM